MTRLSIVLLAAVMFSALYLVRVQYDSRRLFTELDRATAEARRLDVEHSRLEVESAPKPLRCASRSWPRTSSPCAPRRRPSPST